MKSIQRAVTKVGPAMLAAVVSFNALADYPRASITNKTPYPVGGKINYASAFCKDEYFSVGPDATWTSPSSRGVCLITGIWANPIGGKPITAYSSSGTSYGTFLITPTQNDFRIWSKQEFAAENSPGGGKSPGFHIVNQTIWPVSVALSQVGCLYYGTIKPGEAFSRSTGAVWFTIKANIQADGKEPRKDWDCIAPVAIIVGAAVLTAATAGAASFVALPAAGTAAAALAPLTMSATMTVTGAALGGGITGALSGAAGTSLKKITAKEIGDALKPNGDASWAGQYAGPEWPFRCDEKPTYVISGGWGRPTADKDGNMSMDVGTPLRLTKTNGCGNGLMNTASVSQPILQPPAQTAAKGSAEVPGNPDAVRALCQGFSDSYAVVASRGFGFAPADVRTKWVASNCATTPTPAMVPALCQKMSDDFGVVANNTWGRADAQVQGAWVGLNCTASPRQVATAPPAASIANGSVVSLLGAHGAFVVAEQDGRAFANRGAVGPWEKLTMTANADGTWSFRSAHGKYFGAANDGSMRADRDAIGAQEKFMLIRNNDGTVAFKTSFGKYVVAEPDGRLNANRDAIGPWESFKLR